METESSLLFIHTYSQACQKRTSNRSRRTEIQIATKAPKEKSRPINRPTMEWKHDKQTHVYWFSHVPPDSGAIVIALNFYQRFIYGNGALNMQISSFDSMIFVSQIKQHPNPAVNLLNLQLAINSLLFRRSKKGSKLYFPSFVSKEKR